MSDLESCILESLDGADPRLFPFLPELLADLQEMGADPRLIEGLLSSAGALPGPQSRVLDLGCGKGPVSVHLAERTACRCLGLDAMPAFVDAARALCAERALGDLCRFEVADIRCWDPGASRFDLVVLGSIGPVLGPPRATLVRLRHFLAPGGRVVMDEVHARPGIVPRNAAYGTRAALTQAIRDAGFRVVAEASSSAEAQSEGDRAMFEAIRARAEALAKRLPGLRDVFAAYVDAQNREFAVLEEDVVNVTLLLQDAGGV